jgi:cytosine/adenosine deaminase-related metal-dependent hydrolase
MLDLATAGGARTWRLEDEIGSLTPGKYGDLTIVDVRAPHLDAFDDAARASSWAPVPQTSRP